MSVSEILYGFMFVGIVLANVIVLADDNWWERQIVPHTIRIFVGCTRHKIIKFGKISPKVVKCHKLQRIVINISIFVYSGPAFLLYHFGNPSFNN